MLAVRIVIGVVVMLAAIALGLYAGLWLMFVGGLIQVVEAVKADPVEAGGVAWGLVRIFLASTVGVLSAVLVGGLGWSLVSYERPTPRGPTSKQVEAEWRRRTTDDWGF